MWKTILLSIAIIAVLVVIALIVVGKQVSGFTNPSPPSVPTFTMFAAEWCGHCKKAKPGFQEMMGDGTVTVGKNKVACELIDADSGDPKLKAFPIAGYPTFILQKPDGSTKEYKGKREPSGYLEFLNQELA